jgi:ABC-2 type transport system ATP-binding protein
MTELTVEERAEVEAKRISLDLERYSLADALERTLAFSQSFFEIGSPTYRAFRDTAVSLSNRFDRINSLRGSVELQTLDSDEDNLICEINKLARRMVHAVQVIEEGKPTNRQPRHQSASRPIVLLNDCLKNFAGFSLGPISLSIDEGDVLALMGPNASGKSTLLRLILGELAKSKGSIEYPGLRYFPRSWRNLRSAVGYVPQFPPSWNGTLGHHLRYYLSVRGVKGNENHKTVEYYLCRFRLKQYEDYTWSRISGGYRLRVALARELLVEPRLLILDEPLAHLDVDSQLELLDIVRNLSGRAWNPVTVVLTSQHIYETERFCTKVLVLGSSGQLVATDRLSMLGERRPDAIFEIETTAASNDIDLALGEISHEVRGRSPVFIVSVPKEFTLSTLAARFALKKIDITALRDISSSSRPLFGATDERRGEK